MFRALSVAGALLTVFVASPALAGTVSGVMPVTATAVPSCAVAAQPLAFGTLSQVGGTSTDSQTTVLVTCTPGIAYDVGMDTGSHASGGNRYMLSATSTAVIPYQLFSNASHSTPWGNTVGSNTVPGTAAATPTTLTVYGRVPQNAPLVAAGVYSDVVTVSVTF